MRGVFRDELTYYSEARVDPGAIVTIPLRGKEVSALVLGSTEARALRGELRSKEYQLKKIGVLRAERLVGAEFIRAAIALSRFYAAPLGLVLKNLIPRALLARAGKLALPAEEPFDARPREKTKWTLGRVVQSPLEERMSAYRSVVREAFARGESVYVIVPSIYEVESVESALSRGIEEFTFGIHASLPARKFDELWRKILAPGHPILAVGTSMLLSLPRRDLKTIVIERDHATIYKHLTRPYLDTRAFAELLAREISGELIVGDVTTRLETIYKMERGLYSELRHATSHPARIYPEEVIDMRTYREEKPFRIISDPLLKLLEGAGRMGEKTLLLVGRKGFAPSTVCNDCGSVLTCEHCTSPLVLHQEEHTTKSGKKFEETVYVCHKCYARSRANTLCRECGGWRLFALGIGIDRAAEEIKKKFPNAPLFLLESDAAKKAGGGAEIVGQFLAKKGGILLGTEAALYYLSRRVENTAILSIDSLFAIPDFRMGERTTNLIAEVKSLAARRFFVQTRRPDELIFPFLTQGNIGGFYRSELESRKKWNYPPYSVLVKITQKGNREAVTEEMRKLEKLASKWQPIVFPAFTETLKGLYILHALLKIPRESWPDAELTTILRSLSLSYSVVVDPAEIL